MNFTTPCTSSPAMTFSFNHNRYGLSYRGYQKEKRMTQSFLHLSHKENLAAMMQGGLNKITLVSDIHSKKLAHVSQLLSMGSSC
jgi:hypothetical protein